MTTGSRRPLTELPQVVNNLIDARTSDAVFIVDPNYCIVYWDSQAEALTGFLSEEMTGKYCYEVVVGESEGGIPFSEQEYSLMRLCQAKRSISSFEMRLCTRWGRKKWLSVSLVCVDTEEGPYLAHLLRDSQKAHETLEMAKRLVELSSKEQKTSAPKRQNAPELTPRQADVLKLLSEGKPAKEIGKKLYLSQATVRNHIRALRQLLGAHSQLEALAKAREMGLLS